MSSSFSVSFISNNIDLVSPLASFAFSSNSFLSFVIKFSIFFIFSPISFKLISSNEGICFSPALFIISLIFSDCSRGDIFGKPPNSGEGEGEGEGQGEGDYEMEQGELFEIYQKQQQLRQALEKRLEKDGIKSELGQKLLKDMEEVELDLINSGFTNQTLQKMMELQHQLLKLKNATFMQGQDDKRKSETTSKVFDNTVPSQIPKAKEYFNTTEILNRQALPLQQVYKRKVKAYFKEDND